MSLGVEVSGEVAPARPTRADQLDDAADDAFGWWPVADVLARKCELMHRGGHVAVVDGPDAQPGLLDGEHAPEVLERWLR